jgi:hypothetical protein
VLWIFVGLYDEINHTSGGQRFFYDVGRSGLEYRMLERNPQAPTSYGRSMREQGVIRAFDELRAVTRNDLADPSDEIERTVMMFERKAER